MSHIFVSYTHVDKVHLDGLVAWLHNHGFAEQEIWYDQHIASGNNWRDEIATALDESFAVLVITTTNSVKSLYCTYEWAYAMGQGIPTLPLVFDEVSVADMPTPLASKQLTNCTASIPDYLKEQINRFESVPPQVAAMNKTIYKAIYDTHRRFFILGWLGTKPGLSALDAEFGESVIAYFASKAAEACQVLQTLMTDKAFAFSGKQYRFCWKLIDFLKEFSGLPYKVETYLQDRLLPQFDSSWLPAFEYFEGNGRWRKWMRPCFDRDLKDEHNRMEVFGEMMRAFPSFNAYDADILLQNKMADQ
jgi:hypothetical protein